MGEYECDDGNIIDGDGCDHNCKKEENAICKLEGLHNSCLLPNYSIKFEEGMYKFKILFNYDIANMSELINYLKVSINQLSAIPIQSIQQINDSCLDVSLYLDNISTTSTDELSISFPNIPRYINGNQSIGTNILTTKAMTLSKSRDGYESQVVVYTFNTDLYHTLLC
jgi:cysteine-rich repeat protein